MNEQVKRYDSFQIDPVTGASGNVTFVLATDYDALHQQVETLLTENGRLHRVIETAHSFQDALENRIDLLRAELEAARGLLGKAKMHLRASGHNLAADDIGRYLAETATPAPEVPNHAERNLEMAEQGERQEAVHWRAVLSPAEVPMQLNVHEHVAGFTDRRKAEDWIAARLQMDGWHYTLEALYPEPQPGPDVRGLVESASAYLNALDSGAHDYEVKRARHNLRQELAAHRQAQRKGEQP